MTEKAPLLRIVYFMLPKAMTTIAQTDRLTIRSWIPEEDAESAFQIYSDPEVTRFLWI